jgi:DNA replication protein DnaC
VEKIHMVASGQLERLSRRRRQYRRSEITAIAADVDNFTYGYTTINGYDPDRDIMDIIPPVLDGEVVDALPFPPDTATHDDAQQRPLMALVEPQQGQHTPPPPPLSDECSYCHGAGYVRADVPYGHPQFGKAVMCGCKTNQIRKKNFRHLRALSGLDALDFFQRENFENFDAKQPDVENAFWASMWFADQPTGWLVLAGPNGCGKTHLAVSVAKEQLSQGAAVLFLVVADLLDHLRSAFASTAAIPYDELFQQIRDVELLVLDDLGAENGTGWAQEKLFQLLNYRYNAKLATVITTNQEYLEGIEARLRSRLMDRRLVKMVVMHQAQDFRPMLNPEDNDV